MALDKNVAVLIGGVGGAKLARGLIEAIEPQRISFIVNTGDDFWRWGLKICPDIDTLMYTLAGLANPETGWGLAQESFTTLDWLASTYGVEAWFRLGDKDLATHLLRTQLLRQGHCLTEVTACLTRKLGIGARLLPMSDCEVPTIVDCEEHGELGFQEYFVKRRWQPAIRGLRHKNHERAQPSAAVEQALSTADVIIIAPSNPWLSIAPILSVPGMRQLLIGRAIPVVAVTPIIAGAAVKGPTAKIMRELGFDISARAVAEYYGDIINGFVDDTRNPPFERANLRLTRLDTLMSALSVKVALAEALLDWIEGWQS